MFYLMAIVSALGLAAGAVLAKVSPEEISKGEKYFLFLRKLILTALLVTLAIGSEGLWFFMILGFAVGFIFRLNYLYFGLAMAASSGNIMLLISCLIFIYGIPTGSMLVHRNVFRPTIILITLLAFFLPFLLRLIAPNSPAIMALCFGALVHASYSKFMEGKLNSISM